MQRLFADALLACSLFVTLTGAARAQTTASAVDAGSCVGFSFGPWTPPLDWHRSGHAGTPASAASPVAPGGRDWAAAPIHADGEGPMLLFPSWWPVGVTVDLPARAMTPGDTVLGRATALVANGTTPSTSAVRAWRVPCESARGENATRAPTGAATARRIRDRLPIGTWRGTLTCLSAHSQCGSDSIVYRIAAIAGVEDSASLEASIVGAHGERPTGHLRCRYDVFASILSCDAPNGVLRLAVRGEELGGRLTRRDSVDLRYVHVRRSAH